MGKVGDRSGSFVLQHTGTFDGGIARAKLSVVPGSGTGRACGHRRAKGRSRPASAPTGVRSIELDYAVEV